VLKIKRLALAAEGDAVGSFGWVEVEPGGRKRRAGRPITGRTAQPDRVLAWPIIARPWKVLPAIWPPRFPDRGDGPLGFYAGIFMPSGGGISHAPDEFNELFELAARAQLLLDTIRQIDATLTYA
jgi:hypothetical protein